ncbi:hypothetical protein AADZ90_014045 [Aestuariibius sp. 2305UL40-4]|uniref:hypothetical protein n=1 Tax=Aestuariibius violaceus TaxID=3234132 RepID=UPI00345F0E39
MSVQTGKLRCLAGCWAVGGLIGLVAMVLLFMLGGFSSAQAIFTGGLLAIAVGLLLQLTVCRSMPEPGNVMIPGTQSTVAGTHAAPAAPVAEAQAERHHHDEVAVSEAEQPRAEAVVEEPQHEVADETIVEPEPAVADVAPEPVVEEVSPAAAESPASASAAASAAAKPQMMEAPRDGGPDDLKKIKGIGPKLEKMLHGMGIYHFDQIAGWQTNELAWVDENLEGFKGRASRDNWVSQAETLASGGETAFSEKVDKGDVY